MEIAVKFARSLFNHPNFGRFVRPDTERTGRAKLNTPDKFKRKSQFGKP
jgi:hypothetical protein